MSYFYPLLGSLFILVALVSLTLLLRKWSILSTDHEALFSQLVTDVALPALIFASLSRRTFDPDKLVLALLMLCTILIACSLGYIAGRLLKMDRKSLGAFVLVAGWGSSSTLGYALIMQIFFNNTQAMQDAMIVSELGAGIPLFVLSIPFAMYFGKEHPDRRSEIMSVLAFFRSPIFIALVLGIAVSFLKLPTDNYALQTLYKLFDIMGNSLELFTAIAVGLLLQKIPVKHLLPPIAALFCINLVAEPLIALAGAHICGLCKLDEQVLVIEAAMPAGAVAAVIASRYGCNGKLASALTIAMYFLSVLTIPVVYLLTASC